MAHLIQIFCRVALMGSCDDFNQFHECLLSTLIVLIHLYDGKKLKSTLPSPAEEARLHLLQLMPREEHKAMKLIPEEDSEEFQNSIKKLCASGFDPNDSQCFLNEDVDVGEHILGEKCERGG